MQHQPKGFVQILQRSYILERKELRRMSNAKSALAEAQVEMLGDLFLKAVAGIRSAVAAVGRVYAKGFKARGELLYKTGRYL